MPTCKVLIAEADASERGRLRQALAAQPDVTLAPDVADGDEAVRAVFTHRPDAVFLGVRLPGRNGLDVIRTLGPGAVPVVVLMTDVGDGLAGIFEAAGISHLRKPLVHAELTDALDWVRRAVRESQALRLERRLLDFVKGLRTQAGPPDQPLLVRSAGRIHFVHPDDIDWIDACGNYVRLHVGGRAYRVRETMDGIERLLDRRRLLRIHRSRIVNVARVREFQCFADGQQMIVLRGGVPMRVGRTYRSRVRQQLRDAPAAGRAGSNDAVRL
jgi:two-component system LytT family response regulator